MKEETKGQRRVISDAGRPQDVEHDRSRDLRYAIGRDGGFEDCEPRFRSHFRANYGYTGRGYADYRSAYAYGYNLARDPRYRGHNWQDIEAEARQSWVRSHPDAGWEHMKDAVLVAWHTVTRRGEERA